MMITKEEEEEENSFLASAPSSEQQMLLLHVTDLSGSALLPLVPVLSSCLHVFPSPFLPRLPHECRLVLNHGAKVKRSHPRVAAKEEVPEPDNRCLSTTRLQQHRLLHTTPRPLVSLRLASLTRLH